MDTLMRMQNSYDIAQARSHAGEIAVRPYVATTPLRATQQHDTK
jgi:hypothetical protein